MIQENILLEALKSKGYKVNESVLLGEVKTLHKSLEEVLLEKSILSEEDLAKIKAEILKLPVKFFGKNETIDREILNIIDESAARNYKIACFAKDDKAIHVAALYPEDNKVFEAISFISRQLGLKPQLYVTTQSDLQRA